VRTQPFLLIDPRSGDDNPSADEVAEAARQLGVEVHLLEQDEDPGEVARASGAPVLGMAGGDGSLGAVASVAVETDAAFVCIPFGTRNHFARDVGLDRDDPLAALAAFREEAAERRVDLGRAGDRLFLNNVSFGVYARLRKGRKETLYETLNRSINETLPRSVLTHATVFAATLSLLIFAGEVIRPFAWVMAFGVVTGTFSSIYVAAPVLLWIERKWPRKTAARQSSSTATPTSRTRPSKATATR